MQYLEGRQSLQVSQSVKRVQRVQVVEGRIQLPQTWRQHRASYVGDKVVPQQQHLQRRRQQQWWL
jgi:hypothetical protein